MDYLVPEMANTTGIDYANADPDSAAAATAARANVYVDLLEQKLGVPVKAISTGPNVEHLFSTSNLKIRQSGR